MKAVEISAYGAPEALRLAERPDPVAAAGEVLIRVTASGVNRPDVLQRTGNYPVPPGASDIPGLEVAGEIVAGDAAAMAQAGLRTGDRVCALVAGGGYASLCNAPVGQCLPVPKGLSDVEAASLPETFFTVWSNVWDRAKLQPGETLLVQGGTSGIGVTAIQMARALGSRVIATAGSDAKVKACLELGADAAINYRTQDFAEEAKKLTGGARRQRDPRHGGRRLRRPRNRMPGRGRTARDHRGARRDQERVQRRAGAAPAPRDHRLDAAARGRWRSRRRSRNNCARMCGRCSKAARSSR